MTEWLPEIDWTFPHSERYLVQYEDGDMDVVNRVWVGLFTEPYWNCALSQTVVAWMPLPAAYERSK